MAFLSDEALDGGLDWIVSNGTRLDICTQEPTTYAEATSTYTIGNKTGLTVGATQDGDTDGRKVELPAVIDGTVSGAGTGTHWALTDGSSILVATGSLTTPVSFTSGFFSSQVISFTHRDVT